MNRYNLITEKEVSDTVILANGSFPSRTIPLSILNNCKRIIACDGATNRLVKAGKTPTVIVGDCDSLSDENKKQFASIIHQVTEQETNDLSKAVRYCVEQGWKDIIILGATGEREDHTMANISLLAEYLHLANISMVTDYGVFVAISKDSIFDSYKGQQVSLFPLDGQPISVKGLKYQIENKIFDRWWQATLNESEAAEFVIKTDGVVIVYRTFGK